MDALRGDLANAAKPKDASVFALDACKRVLRPVVRMALSLGLKHSHLQRLLTDLLLDEGQRVWREQAVEPNISQLSVTTGLNRKAITLRVRAPAADLHQTAMSAAARTLTLWVQLWEDDPSLLSLPLVAQDGAMSFEAVARRASRGDLHHRAVLEELVRLNMAQVLKGRVSLKTLSFVPSNDLRTMLAVLGDNAHDHLAAAVSNVLQDHPPMLERAIYARGLSAEDCNAIQNLVSLRWATLHHELADKMTHAVDANSDSAGARIRVGIYAYTEELETSEKILPPGPRVDASKDARCSSQKP